MKLNKIGPRISKGIWLIHIIFTVANEVENQKRRKRKSEKLSFRKNRMNHAKKIIMRIRINVFREKVSKSHYSEKNKGYIFKTQNVYRMKLLGK